MKDVDKYSAEDRTRTTSHHRRTLVQYEGDGFVLVAGGRVVRRRLQSVGVVESFWKIVQT